MCGIHRLSKPPGLKRPQPALEAVDDATTNGPAYYMISCAHPEHFDHMFTHGKPWLERIRSIRADASRKGQAELDESDMLDEENTEELSKQYRALRNLLPNLTVVGGCYGTDHRHVAAIARAFREQ